MIGDPSATRALLAMPYGSMDTEGRVEATLRTVTTSTITDVLRTLQPVPDEAATRMGAARLRIPGLEAVDVISSLAVEVLEHIFADRRLNRTAGRAFEAIQ